MYIHVRPLFSLFPSRRAAAGDRESKTFGYIKELLDVSSSTHKKKTLCRGGKIVRVIPISRMDIAMNPKRAKLEAYA